MPFRLFALLAAVLFAIAHAWHLELDDESHFGRPHILLSAGLPDDPASQRE